MAKILWQREVDARHDLAVAVMRLSDAPDAMYDHFIPTGPGMKAPRWRTNMCGSEPEAIDLLRFARDSLERHVAKDPEMNSVLRWYNCPKWKFRQKSNPGHTVLSLACTGPQASDFVRNEPALLGACVAGCLEAYGEGHIFGGMIGTAYAIASTRILRLWLTSFHGEPGYRTSNCYNIRRLLYESWRRVVFNARAQVGESYGGFWYPILEPRYSESEIISNLRNIYIQEVVHSKILILKAIQVKLRYIRMTIKQIGKFLRGHVSIGQTRSSMRSRPAACEEATRPCALTFGMSLARAGWNG